MKKAILLCSALFSASVVADGGVSFKPDNQEALNAFIHAMLDNDKTAFLKGNNSMVESGLALKSVTASELIAAYRKNELSANKIYKGNLVRIRTVAASIQEDAMGKAYITANGKKGFENVFLYVDKNDDRVLELSKGDKIDFTCTGGGMSLSIPLLRECKFTSDMATPVYAKLTDNAKKASEPNYKPQFAVEAYLVGMYKTEEGALAQPCLKSAGDCVNTVEKLQKANGFAADKIGQYVQPYKTLPMVPKP